MLRKLKQKFVSWLLKGVHLDEIHIGEHSVVISGTGADMDGQKIENVGAPDSDDDVPRRVFSDLTGRWTLAQAHRGADGKIMVFKGPAANPVEEDKPAGDMAKAVYDPDADGKIALAQLVDAVCSETEAKSYLGSLAATCYVVASDAKAEVKAFAQILQTAGYPAWVCDGTDDHLEVQAALDALPATGGEVRLLDGTYNIGASLVLNSYQTLRGQGRNTILTTTAANLDIITATGGDGSEKIGILIADLCVDGNAGGVASDIGILWTYVDHSRIINTWMQDNGEDGIKLITCDFNEIIGNTCQGNTDYGIGLFTSNNNTVTGNTCQGNTDSGIYLHDSSSNNTVTGNTCQGNGYGIYLFSSANNNTISGNTCQGNTKDGIYLRSVSNNNTVTGNTCQGNGIYGITLSSANNNTISGNTCQGNTDSGIYLDTSSDNTISGNTCQENGSYGIGLYGSKNNIISDNSCIANSQTTTNTRDDIYLNKSDYNLIESNLCRAGALANVPRYGINISNATSDKNVIVGNDLYDDGFGTAPFNDVGTLTMVRDDNRDITQVQVKHLIYVQNTSGGNLLTGNVVKYNAAAGSVGFTTPTAVGDDGVWGMLVEDIDNNAYGYIQVLGGTTLLDTTNAGGAIVIGDFLCAEIGVRARLAVAGDMVFAIALEDCDAVDCVIDALIIVPRKI